MDGEGVSNILTNSSFINKDLVSQSKVAQVCPLLKAKFHSNQSLCFDGINNQGRCISSLDRMLHIKIPFYHNFYLSMI